MSAYRMTLVLISIMFFYKVAIKDPKTEISLSDNLNFYHLVYFAWVIYGFTSFFWVESRSRWLFGMFFIVTGALSIFYITFNMRSKKDIKTLFIIVFLMTSFHQMLGWYEVVTGNYLWKHNRVGAAITTFGNINDYATLLLTGIFIGLLILLISTNHWLKLYSVLHMISGLLLLSHGGSRGNQLGLIIGISVFLILNILNLNLSRKFFKYSLAIVIAFVFVLLVSSTIREQLFDLYGLIQTSLFRDGGSNRYRINLLINGFAFLLQTYGFGVGAGNIEYWMANRPFVEDIDAMNIHNWFMEILVGYGVIIFMLYTIMYIYIVRKLYLNYKYNSDSFIKNTSMVLLIYAISFLASSISSASNIFIEWQWVFWGIIISFIQYTEREKCESTLSE
ncbi:O-antigen ligase family protein [Alkalibacterium sp. f15]|uniref:O-antigen ligase family protein n=1 Tax=Alkalibacterium sp. f15 TaxID=3414029 RepID=UPI003BF7E81B